MALFDNLTAYWKMNAASGNEPDSRNFNTLIDDTTTGSTSGVINGARDFSNDLLHAVSSSDLTGHNDWSIAAWFKSSTPSQYLIHKGWTDGGASREWLLFGIDDSGDVQFNLTVDNGSTTEQVQSSSYTAGDWHLVVAVHDGTNNELRISVDGGSFVTQAWSGGLQSAGANFWVGKQPSGGYTGQVDEIGFWDRALVSGDVSDLWNGGAGTTYTDASPAAGQGLIDVTGVAATVNRPDTIPQQAVELKAIAPAAPIDASPLTQPIDIRSITPGVARPWTSGDPGLLELTAVAPTVRFSAAAGLGRLAIRTPGITTVESVGTSGIGHLALRGVAPAGAHAAASGQGLIDLTPVSATSAKSAIHEWGRVWLAEPAANVNFSAASGQGLMDVTYVTAAARHEAASGVGLIDVVHVAIASSHGADAGPGALDFVSSAPTSAKSATSGQGLIDVSYVVATTTKGADSGPAPIELTPIAAATTKAAPHEVSGLDFSGVAAAGSHRADAGPVVLELAGVSPETAKAAGISAAAIDLVGPALNARHGAAAGVVAVDLVGIIPTTPKQAAAEVAELTFEVQTVGVQSKKFPGPATFVRPRSGGWIRPRATGQPRAAAGGSTGGRLSRR